MIEDICCCGDRLFSKRENLLNLWQEIAMQFYPQRADFTRTISIGSEITDHLMTSDPLLAHRDTSNIFSTMLRPSNQQWMHINRKNSQVKTSSAKAWLEMAEQVQRRAMYDTRTQFVRATKEGDRDFIGFGQCVLTAEKNRDKNGVLYRSWHLRDVAWAEGLDGTINEIHRKWKPTAQSLVRLFGAKCHQKVIEMSMDPKRRDTEINVRHVVMESDCCGSEFKRFKYVSMVLDVDNKVMIEEVGTNRKGYIIPRWQTVSGSQYAYSPATIAALPEARLIQAITRVLLEAGEKATNPPMVAVQDAIRSDISIYAGGVTWVDAEYGDKLYDVLRPLTQDKQGLPMGMEMRDDIRNTIASCFYLNKIQLPPAETKEMTAYETKQRVDEYIRNSLPLFEPVETEYNAPLCEETFEILMELGAFGSVHDIPDELRGADVQFHFESPLHDAIERQKGHDFQEAAQLLATAAQIDSSIVHNVDMQVAFRDTFMSIGAPASWLRKEDDVKADQQAEAQKVQMAQELAMTQHAAQAAQSVSQAQSMNQEAQRAGQA